MLNLVGRWCCSCLKTGGVIIAQVCCVLVLVLLHLDGWLLLEEKEGRERNRCFLCDSKVFNVSKHLINWVCLLACSVFNDAMSAMLGFFLICLSFECAYIICVKPV